MTREFILKNIIVKIIRKEGSMKNIMTKKKENRNKKNEKNKGGE